MAKIVDLFNATLSKISDTNGNTAMQFDSNGTANSLVVTQNALLGGATIAPLSVVASLASQAVVNVSGVFLSTASINLAANQTAFIIPVYHASNQTWGYIACSKGVV